MSKRSRLGAPRKVASFDPIRVLDRLKSHGVRFVVIGGFAGRLWGSNVIIDGLDICYARDKKNYRALAAALGELDARLSRGPEYSAVVDAKVLESGDRFTFETNAGMLVCLGTPAGSGGFLELIRGATEMVVGSAPISVAALEDVIRLKRCGQASDLVEVEILAALREEIQLAKRQRGIKSFGRQLSSVSGD